MSRLRAVPKAPVAHAARAGAQHADDALHSIRAELAVDAVHRFLGVVYSACLRRKP